MSKTFLGCQKPLVSSYLDYALNNCRHTTELRICCKSELTVWVIQAESFTVKDTVYTTQEGIDGIKSNPQVYTTQECIEEIKSNP